MEMNDDPDPEMPPSGTPMHPIEISSGSSFHGGHTTATATATAATTSVTIEAKKIRCTDVRAWGFPLQHPQHSSSGHYPPLYEDPQMGGPSNPVSEVDSTPVAPPPPPHMGYDNPIPSYTGAAAYNPFEQPAYLAVHYNALHPEGPFQAAYPTGYPPYGYQYPPHPQPQPQQQPQPPQFQPPQQHEILQLLHEVEQQVEEERRSRRGLLKGLEKLIKGKKKRDY
ncbi:leucine-rich repeat extensin-like protein 5 [Helianthus annuus]|uniref:leucine-rich repeat extensin-like protein 5 n=1 Tax=Helianthus annuus TaxID=4232 RepID=UPI00165319C9|nr:leucine-rich repeat extensin-like protein 5 [Helianthus annuus]